MRFLRDHAPSGLAEAAVGLLDDLEYCGPQALGAMEPARSPDEAADAMGILCARSMAALQGALRPSP